MKFIKYAFIVLILLSITHLSFAAGNNNYYLELANNIKEIQNDLKTTNDKLAEVRRDQLNYKVEKDLLKETYSSNIQTINIVITLILALFTIIGYLGVKGIWALQKEFKGELQELKLLKGRYETKFDEIDKQQKEAQLKLQEVGNKNEEQELRLRILELQEKIHSLIKIGNYSRALEFASVGLKLSSKDTFLLNQKSICLFRLRRHRDAIECLEQILNIDPDNIMFLQNYCEVCLLMKEYDKYDKTIEKHRNILTEIKGNILISYYDAIKLTHKGNVDNLKELIKTSIHEVSPDQAPRILGWDFQEAKYVFKNEGIPCNYLFLNYIKFLEGNIDLNRLVSILDQENKV